MNTKYAIITIAAITATALAIGYIVYSTTVNTQTEPVELRVSIASSLIHVAEDMAAKFEKDHNNNVKIILNSGSSSTLYTQIASGAPVDVFMSADQKWLSQLLISDIGLLNNRYENFTTNSLEIIIAPGNPANITSIADLAKPGVKLVLAAPSVPAGSYANSTIWKIDSTLGNPSSPQYDVTGVYKNFNASIYQNVVSYENSVEQVVGKVSLDLGIADAGIVFVSDGVYGTNTGAQVSFIQIPSEVNMQGIYGIGIVGSTQQSEFAQKFMDYWLSKTGKELLTEYGFNS